MNTYSNLTSPVQGVVPPLAVFLRLAGTRNSKQRQARPRAENWHTKHVIQAGSCDINGTLRARQVTDLLRH